MGQKSVTLQIPAELYTAIQQAAEAAARPMETVLLESLEALFQPILDYQDENLSDQYAWLGNASDAQLWAVVYRHLPWAASLRLHELNARAKANALSDAEADELQTLLEQVDRAMLLRSEALLLLKQRGYNLSDWL